METYIIGGNRFPIHPYFHFGLITVDQIRLVKVGIRSKAYWPGKLVLELGNSLTKIPNWRIYQTSWAKEDVIGSTGG